MNRDEVLEIVKLARAWDGDPDFRGMDLSGLDLRGIDLSVADLRCADLCDADLRDADLRGADLRCVNLRDADLRGADLRDADLRGADLSVADLRCADLCDADLREADLRDADLRGADLRDADLRGADLRGINLRGAYLDASDLMDAQWHGLLIDRLPSGKLTLIPTPSGWKLKVGCWHGTPDELRTLIAQKEGWPEAEGEEITRRRPYLEAALALCEVHMTDHAHVIDDLAQHWNTTNKETD